MTKHILIIDDDDRVLVTTRALLEREGYSVTTTSSPFGASKLIREQQPNLVLLDVNMPALSGEGLAEVLRRNDRIAAVPIAFYSSNDVDSLRAAAARLDVAGYICKGDLAELRNKVQKLAR